MAASTATAAHESDSPTRQEAAEDSEFTKQSIANWYIIYPNYIDADKTIQKGRRIEKGKAISRPAIDDMKAICDHLKIPNVVEQEKAYPRDWQIKGRIRVKFVNAENGFYNEEIKSKRQLMLKMGELMPKLKSRQKTQSPAVPDKNSKTAKNKKKRK